MWLLYGLIKESGIFGIIELLSKHGSSYQSFRDKFTELDTRLSLLQEAEDYYYIRQTIS